jgi:G3E family GTPase
MNLDQRIPVTLLTGFLGAGKTTLLNRILGDNHGLRIAVIENEFGEVGIDQALVMRSEEEIFEMNNGCLCCTVRGDLIRILGQLVKRKQQFDRILIETTGMADPAPVIQTFFMDDDMRDQFRVEGVVTVVDAFHIDQHLGQQRECAEQIAFADVILLNKADLVADLAPLERRIQALNPTARLHKSIRGDVDLATVLDVGGFDLARTLTERPDFLQPEYPFEWLGLFKLDQDIHLHFGACGHDHHHHDHHDHHHGHSHDHGEHPVLALLPLADEASFSTAADRALRGWRDAEAAHTLIEPRPNAYVLDQHRAYTLRVPAAGWYAVALSQAPEALHLHLHAGDKHLRPTLTRYFEHSHHHDEEVMSVGIVCQGEVDSSLFQGWMKALLATEGANIFRSKGVLNLYKHDRRYVFQGVHMLMDGALDRAWGVDENRENRLVFIGKNLNRQRLNEAFLGCLRG